MISDGKTEKSYNYIKGNCSRMKNDMKNEKKEKAPELTTREYRLLFSEIIAAAELLEEMIKKGEECMLILKGAQMKGEDMHLSGKG